MTLRQAGSAAIALLALTLSAAEVTREVAVTFDDLPMVPQSTPIAEQQRITRDLLRSIRAEKIPAIGFVNEGKLGSAVHVALLDRWLDAGLELGNHTHSHPDLHRIDVAEYEQDIVRGEKVTRELMRKRGKTPRWFRHPFLHTGRSLEVRDRVTRFLGKHGYRVAPVTLDNGEWIFASAYAKTQDAKARKRIGTEYVAYMDRKLAYYERQSQDLFGRNIRHVLLVHANALNADWFDEVAASMKKRGYRFITLERALEDPAYRSKDEWTGFAGISWLHRWALTLGKEKAFFAAEPMTPRWVLDAAGVESE
ncbi:MAG TPA: polysaccharide deacetylase family protein [Thermoanaerobaculia bacterium]|nr:polysaccharide deacetylase family protein [Thermoanaerobaculia bacterium]